MELKQKLYELYVIQKMSQLDCASVLNISHSSVRYYLKQYDISRNNRNVPKNGTNRECTKCKTTKTTNDFYYQSYKSKRKSRQGSWCKSCMKKQVIERQRKYKQQALDYKGSKCQSCGYNKYQGALEFHHRDPKEKDIELSKFSKSPLSDSGKKELDKCDLLCSNCHREVHALTS
ncbi:MAG: hypothetical protein KDH96_12345 [Candidatus Riesia sp.]|nr:hypothetical protein [Candidatus Riesia sp.]